MNDRRETRESGDAGDETGAAGRVSDAADAGEGVETADDVEAAADQNATDDTEAAIRAGVALFTVGEYRAAAEAWETAGARATDDDERLLRGLSEAAAAVASARGRDWLSARESADTAHDALGGGDRRGVAVGALRSFCRLLAADPSVIDRRDPPPIRVANETVRPADLSPAAVEPAALALAETAGYDAAVVADAVAFARADRDRARRDGPGAGPATDESAFTRFLRAFLVESAARGVVFDRLRAHVDRRRRERSDVRSLFE